MTLQRRSLDCGLRIADWGQRQPSFVANPQSLNGFTLIELLLALTLLAVISGGMAVAFSTSLRAAERIQHRAEAGDERRILVEQLRADLQGVWIRPGSQTTWFRGGNAVTSTGRAVAARGDTLELTTARPISIDADQSGGGHEGTLRPQSDVAQVSWQVEPDTTGSLVLVRRERTPADPEVDDTEDPSVVRTAMSRSVTGLQVLFFDGTQWLEEWNAAASPQDGSTAGGGGQGSALGLPQAVQVTLTFAPEPAGRRGETRALPSAEDLPLRVVVAMPGAEGPTTASAGGSG